MLHSDYGYGKNRVGKWNKNRRKNQEVRSKKQGVEVRSNR